MPTALLLYNKKCSKCKILRSNVEFYLDLSKKDGCTSYCKVCRKASSSNYANKNKDLIKKFRKAYFQRNKQEIYTKIKKRLQALSCEEQIKYKQDLYKKKKEAFNNKSGEEKNRIRAKRLALRRLSRQKRSNDEFWRLKENLRWRCSLAIKRKRWLKNSYFNNYIGCSLERLKLHIESQFSEGMNWSNYGKWHVDHIIPVSSATTYNKLIDLFHYTNLQPLWAIDNMKKGAKCPQ